ncbi:MAG: hypothetical protein LBK47_08125 [Prevotellaceae bacterium]|jgi:hypothetical protein|nr:hypothetical protein [Prevotellaceae bacterium]
MGFTGHEHLPEFGLINMNARLYDPLLGRFLSPDPYVANAGYLPDFNFNHLSRMLTVGLSIILIRMWMGFINHLKIEINNEGGIFGVILWMFIIRQIAEESTMIITTLPTWHWLIG